MTPTDVQTPVDRRSVTPGTGLAGHPKGVLPLVFAEVWERFSWNGMRGILVLFLVSSAHGGLGVAPATAVAIYGIYNSVAYMLAVPGGWLGGRVLGSRRAVLLGGTVLALGHFSMAVPSLPTLCCGLLAVAVGTGLIKPNIAAMVGELYEQQGMAHRKDAGFTTLYVGVNIGSFAAPLVVGTAAEKVNWHVGFAIAGIGMLLSLLVLVLSRRTLSNIGRTPAPMDPQQRSTTFRRAGIWITAGAVILATDVVSGAFSIDHVVNVMPILGVGIPVLYFFSILRNGELAREDRLRIKAYIWFFGVAVLFWMIYDQSGSLLSLFADGKTDRNLGGWEFPASWFQSVNPALVILLGPALAALWVAAARRSREPGTVPKFSLALVLVGASFGVMAVAGWLAKGDGVTKVSVLWLLAVYLLQTIGELCLAPVGLALSTELAPAAFVSQLLGLWYMAGATGHAIDGWATQLNEPMGDTAYYSLWALVALVTGVSFLFCARRLTDLMRGIR
ncbi:MFS transporter [Streptomyces coacervatus]|uniref:MFS transporter n=1 Tax=Streptomyces coacervatus TaxID=647381 RepID=A0ABP7H276_9ACTN|nr:oligopeptide:H+ symporter [Streptomyces coacervatus]MDF2268113.1 oligopeptide:H+ symporter [Streptomyces coacervatus]